jgi:RNA polymerase sigma-70 factor (sigma-E family)
VRADATSEAAGREAPRTDPGGAGAAAAVTGLYQSHAVGLIRLAVVMLGDRPAAEDVVQDAFAGLYRRWAKLADPGKALAYLRSSTMNGCRNELRRRIRARRRPAEQITDAASAEFAALVGEDHREVLAGLRRLPARQREALVLRYYADLSESEIARSMGISRGAVKSHTSRGMSALRTVLDEAT